jgi:hypothetical protein
MRGVLDAKQPAEDGSELASVGHGGPQKILRAAVILAAVQVAEPHPTDGVTCRYPCEDGQARGYVEVLIPAALLEHRAVRGGRGIVNL